MAYVFPTKCPVTSKSDLREPRKMKISLALGSGPIGSSYLQQNPLSPGDSGKGKALSSAPSSAQMRGPDANSGFAAVLRADS